MAWQRKTKAESERVTEKHVNPMTKKQTACRISKMYGEQRSDPWNLKVMFQFYVGKNIGCAFKKLMIKMAKERKKANKKAKKK